MPSVYESLLAFIRDPLILGFTETQARHLMSVALGVPVEQVADAVNAEHGSRMGVESQVEAILATADYMQAQGCSWGLNEITAFMADLGLHTPGTRDLSMGDDSLPPVPPSSTIRPERRLPDHLHSRLMEFVSPPEPYADDRPGFESHQDRLVENEADKRGEMAFAYHSSLLTMMARRIHRVSYLHPHQIALLHEWLTHFRVPHVIHLKANSGVFTVDSSLVTGALEGAISTCLGWLTESGELKAETFMIEPSRVLEGFPNQGVDDINETA